MGISTTVFCERVSFTVRKALAPVQCDEDPAGDRVRTVLLRRMGNSERAKFVCLSAWGPRDFSGQGVLVSAKRAAPPPWSVTTLKIRP